MSSLYVISTTRSPKAAFYNLTCTHEKQFYIDDIKEKGAKAVAKEEISNLLRENYPFVYATKQEALEYTKAQGDDVMELLGWHVVEITAEQFEEMFEEWADDNA